MDAWTIPHNWAQLVKESEDFISEDETELAKLWSLSDYQIEDAPDDEEQLDLGSTQRMDNIYPSKDLLMPTMPDLEELTNHRSTIIRTEPERFDPSVNLTSNLPHNDNTGHTKDCKNQRQGHKFNNFFHIFYDGILGFNW